MHLNSVQIIGRLSKRPELRYTESGTPFCSLVVAVDEHGKDGATFTTWLPVDITGKYAQQTSVELEEGDEVQISGKLKYKSTIDKHTQQKTSKLIISTWGIQQRQPATTSPEAVPDSAPQEAAFNHEAPSTPETHKPRKPRYGKHRQQPWAPSGVMSEN